MTTKPPPGDSRKLRFSLRELAGSLGDLGTFLPLTVALAVATGLDLGWMLIGAGAMNIATGVLFRMPLPVQPMKAIAAVAIAEGLSGGAVIAAGWLMGGVLTVLAVVGLMPWIDRGVPRPVVRAIQLGVGMKLLYSGVLWVGELDATGANSVMVAAVLAGALVLGVLRSWPLVLPVFLVGFAVIAIEHQEAYAALRLNWPQLQWVTPTRAEWSAGLLEGALPQLPLTLLNSVIAVCALSGDYFPGRAISPRRMALSVGLMNLTCVGWAGLPMCHGSGGLAAQYGAGARTGGSVVMLGACKLLAGLAFGASLMPLMAHYPAAVLGPLVGLAGGALAYAGGRALRGSDWVVAAPAAAVMLATQTLYGFALGVGRCAGVGAGSAPQAAKPGASKRLALQRSPQLFGRIRLGDAGHAVG